MELPKGTSGEAGMHRASSGIFCAVLGLCLICAVAGYALTAMAQGPQISNPASENCIRQGGKLEIYKSRSQGEYALCVFPDGSQCEEWALYRGECSIEEVTSDRKKTYLDPFGYCKAVGTIDTPDFRYVGPKFPDSLARSMVIQGLVSADAPDDFRKSAMWRCMDHKVWVCQFGANIPCREKADTSKDPPPGMIDYCKANPAAQVIPAYVAGRATIYEWTCKDGKPRIARQVTNVDQQGYPVAYWTELKP